MIVTDKYNSHNFIKNSTTVVMTVAYPCFQRIIDQVLLEPVVVMSLCH